MSLSFDCWSIVVQFCRSKDRLSLLLTSKMLNDSCKTQPIWFRVFINSNNIPVKNLLMLRDVELKNWKDKDWESISALLDVVCSVTIVCSKSLTFIPSMKTKSLVLAGNGNIKNIGFLPECKTFCCSSEGLTTLPKLPKCKHLDCSYNKITEIVDVPCSYLDCSNNMIERIENIPNCKYLYCSDNKIKSLPVLQKCKRLYCSQNQLCALPDLPVCKELSCSFNMIREINLLPE
jgi:Leucine-rich repeat (LRR) protein